MHAKLNECGFDLNLQCPKLLAYRDINHYCYAFARVIYKEAIQDYILVLCQILFLHID